MNITVRTVVKVRLADVWNVWNNPTNR